MGPVFATISRLMTSSIAESSGCGHTSTESRGPRAAASRLRGAAEVAVVQACPYRKLRTRLDDQPRDAHFGHQSHNEPLTEGRSRVRWRGCSRPSPRR